MNPDKFKLIATLYDQAGDEVRVAITRWGVSVRIREGRDSAEAVFNARQLADFMDALDEATEVMEQEDV